MCNPDGIGSLLQEFPSPIQNYPIEFSFFHWYQLLRILELSHMKKCDLKGRVVAGKDCYGNDDGLQIWAHFEPK
jgi:hypothetical protein